ncbi:hypothetical protein RirG_009770 [Rhizophagus irregularis DAOM 197198w]|uniref:Uncharacterized protein n=1 Tax=Rhizophagus irregularis (strain DAOM 197198w) TaxID=1432141 RepID=A0A015M1W7_RHIIW|nr:hypothetical protein RirG_009770 [Rhizophagus irregularis DAOM 197198w]
MAERTGIDARESEAMERDTEGGKEMDKRKRRAAKDGKQGLQHAIGSALAGAGNPTELDTRARDEPGTTALAVGGVRLLQSPSQFRRSDGWPSEHAERRDERRDTRLVFLSRTSHGTPKCPKCSMPDA